MGKTKKAVKLVKNEMVWYGMVMTCPWVIPNIFFGKTFVFLSKIPIPKKLVFSVLGCFVGYLWQLDIYNGNFN